MHGAPVIDETPSPRSVARVRAVPLARRVARPRRAFLGALAGHDQGAAAEEAILRPDQRVHDADLQRGRAPSDRQVGRDLGETQAGVARAVTASCVEPVRRLEHDRRRGRVLAQHLTQEAALAPGEVDRQAEGRGERPAIGGTARPIHEGRAAPVHLVVVQLDPGRVRTGLQQGEQAGHAVLAARQGDKDAVVGRKRQGWAHHAASAISGEAASSSLPGAAAASA